MTIAIHNGDCLEVIPRLVADGLVCDAVVTDAPYHLTATQKRFGAGNSAPAKRGRDGAMVRLSGGFMGQQWDGGDIAFRPETWATIATIMRPGAFLVAFGGTRTFHRLVCAIEDAGFVVQDQIAWLYSTGFPKRRDMLKPAHEPVCLAYKPGGKRTMGVDECRIGTDAITIGRRGHSGDRGIFGDDARKYERESLGRWPANVAHDGSDEVLAAFPESAVSGSAKNGRPAKWNDARIGRGVTDFATAKGSGTLHNDTGSAARFFYTAKADKQDRYGSRHPTVKPVDLIRWLVRLVTPPGGLVLDPFAGSGTTGTAAFAEGRNAILIERQDQYITDIRERMAWYEGGGMHSTAAKARRTEDKPLGGLFDMAPT